MPDDGFSTARPPCLGAPELDSSERFLRVCAFTCVAVIAVSVPDAEAAAGAACSWPKCANAIVGMPAMKASSTTTTFMVCTTLKIETSVFLFILATNTVRVAHPLPNRPCQHVHQLRDLLPLLRLVAARNRMLDTMPNVIFQHSFLNPPQRCTHSGYLGDNIDAITLLIDHLGDAAHLAFDLA